MKFSIVKTKVFLFLGAALFSIFLINSVNAQSGTTGVSGTVTDAQGASVAGATVTLTDPAKNFSRNVVTDENGKYNFSGILPGTYNIEVEKQGFKKSVQTGIQAAIENPIEINVLMEVGNVGETVTVTADTIDSVINSQDATIGINFQSVQIQQLPTDSRNVNTLLSLQPGVTPGGYVNGGRSDQANITLDGVDINDQQQNPAFTSVLRLSAEAVDEFRVTTSNPNANQGRSSGAQIALLTRSGGNDFSGVAFWNPRRTTGSANSFTNNRSGRGRANINRDVFGGVLGGPIVKDRFFFFYSYEGLRENVSTEVLTTVPLPSLGQGIVRLKDEDGNTITITPQAFNQFFPGVGQNPAALAVLAAAANRYPANDFDSGAGDNLNTAGFRFNANTPVSLNTHIGRLDYIINDNQQLFFRGNVQNDELTGASAFPDTFSPVTWSHNTGFVVGHSWVIGNNKVNNFRVGLTRQAFTAGGDATENAVSFRFVYSPLNFSYTLSRVTPVWNFTDDFSWTKGDHTFQFGGNIRLIRNKRFDTSAAYDTAVINPSYYSGSGSSLLTPLLFHPTNNPNGYNIDPTDVTSQAAIAAVIGRFSQYSANYNYDLDGTLLPTGTPIERTFATEEYEAYFQDSWKMYQNLTVNLGLRYSLSRPVYETNGYQIRPTVPLGEYFAQRTQSAARGVPYNEPLNFELAGPKNDAPGFYSLDKNNFQPRISAAWSPNFKNGFWGKLFGANGESVFRGGFAITNDFFGQQLAVTFNNLSTLGFLTSDNIAPNSYNTTSRLGPLFTGFGQQINNLPGMAPLPDRFTTPADEDTRIEFSLDSTLRSPINYNWSFSYGRKLPKGLYVEASYVGRMARNLLVQRDIMMPNNLVDPASGADWYTAAGKIYDAYYSGVAVENVAPIPYFENLFPELAGYFDPTHTATQTVAFVNENFALGDWTYMQLLLDDSSVFFDDPTLWSNRFYQPQYAAFAAFSTVGKSNYHGGSLSFRQRLGDSLMWDFNYTYSKSLDDASGLQTSGAYGTAFILNAIRQQDSYSFSDFDTRHVINANGLWQLPFGRGRKYFSDMNPVANVFLGGWQLGGIFRWNSGQPFNNLIDLAGWATNWQLRSSVVRTKAIQTSPTRGGNGKPANIFSNLDELARSVRPARPGETGDRNVFRGTGFSQLDLNLGKTFSMPWGENHKLQFRWEVFNVLNKQYLDEQTIGAFSITPSVPLSNQDVDNLTEGTGEFTSIKGNPRRMQFVIRYSF